MITYRGWTWLDSATEEQMDSAANKGACDRLAEEARHIYDSIPDPSDEYSRERLDDYLCSLEEDEPGAAEHYMAKRAKETKAKFGQLEAIEELLAVRGARFARDYEHWNEDEKAMEYLENRYDNEREY